MATLNGLLGELRNPGNRYRVAPFWFWNHDLEEEELKRQIAEMQEKGIGGFVMHARLGRITPYMSQQWLRLIRVAAEEAKRRGMWAWLYDEDNWPSGPVGARVTDEHPEFRMRHIYLDKTFLHSGPAPLEVEMGSEGLYLVQAARESGGKVTLDTLKDLTGKVKKGQLSWSTPEGTWRVWVIREWVYEGAFFGHYLDILNPAATAKFMQMTHDAYWASCKEYFGKSIKGIFTDEPGLGYMNKPKSIPWTWALPAKFKEATNKDLRSVIGALFFDCGPETAGIRCRYYDVVVRMLADAFYKPIWRFCERTGIRSIGHVIHEGPLFESVRWNVDFFRLVEHMHWGGVDSLTHATIEGIGNLVGSKLASSVSHLFGKERTMDEIFGLADHWGFNLRATKLIADWHAILGINYFIPHAFYYSIQGFRKWECIPDEFYHVPYWPYYRKFADHNARVSCALSGARHVADVAVLYPSRSMHASMNPDRTNESGPTEQEFNELSRALIKAHFDFDYISEELIEKGDVRGGRLRIRKKDRELESFSVLILPGVSTLKWATARKIGRFVETGGKLVLTKLTPSKSFESGDDPGMAAFFGELLDKHPGRIVLMESGTSPLAVQKTLSALVDPDVQVEPIEGDAGMVCYAHYVKGSDNYLVLNVSETAPARFRLSLRGGGHLYRADTEKGVVEKLPGVKQSGGRVEVEMGLLPTESCLLLRSGQAIRGARVRAPRPATQRSIPLQSAWKFRTLKPNALPLMHWRYDMGVTKASATHTYETHLFCDRVPSRAMLLLDGVFSEYVWNEYKPATLTINGESYFKGLSGPRKKETRLKDPRVSWGTYLDPYILELDVQKALREGENTVRISTHGALFDPANLSDPVLLVGDFKLVSSTGGWHLAEATGEVSSGSWCDQGYPFYSGIAEYTQSVDLPPAKAVFLRLEKVAEMAEVVINRKSAAVLAWEPFEADISRYVKEGANTITLLVANTMSNLFSHDARPSGILGGVFVDLA